MDNQQLFHFNGAQIRTVIKEEDPWFVAKDVCDALEIGNVSDALRRLEDDEKGLVLIDTLGGQQSVLGVNESGIYELTLGSRKKEAKAFKRWVKREVLPTIRKHGAYMTPETIEKTLTNPDFIIQLATKLKEEQTARIAAESKIQADRPKVLFAEALEVSSNCILIGELAKLLKQNGIDVGQNRLFDKLRQEGYLMRSKDERWNDPTQRAMEMGLFEVKVRTINNPDGSVRTTKTTKVTGKGCIYFVNKFKSAEGGITA